MTMVERFFVFGLCTLVFVRAPSRSFAFGRFPPSHVTSQIDEYPSERNGHGTSLVILSSLLPRRKQVSEISSGMFYLTKFRSDDHRKQDFGNDDKDRRGPLTTTIIRCQLRITFLIVPFLCNTILHSPRFQGCDPR